MGGKPMRLRRCNGGQFLSNHKVTTVVRWEGERMRMIPEPEDLPLMLIDLSIVKTLIKHPRIRML